MLQKWNREAAALRTRTIEWRRQFHRFPEPSMQEHRTARMLEGELMSLGLSPRRVGDTGIIADIQGGEAGPMVALRADTDGLPVQEESGLPYASQHEGYMHACGHDAHMAMLLGAASILYRHRDRLSGTVRLLFQPGEESAQGALSLLEGGALRGVGAVLALHVWADLPGGVFSLEAGPRMAFSDFFQVKIKGRGGHAAAPHQTVDALLAAAATVVNLQSLVSREVSPLDPVVVTVGRLQAGTRFNIIADQAEMDGTVRGFDPEMSAEAMVRRLVEGTAATYRAQAQIDYRHLVPVTVNDHQLSDLATCAVKALFGAEALGEMTRITGSEDFAYYGEHMPVLMGFLGVRNQDIGACYPHHHPRFNLDEEVLPRGVAFLAGMAWEFLRNRE